MRFAQELETKGFAIAPDIIAPDDLCVYQDAVELALKNNDSRERAPGLRNVFETVEIARHFAVCSRLLALLEPILGAKSFAVRALFFDKNLDDKLGANWKVPFHQDNDCGWGQSGIAQLFRVVNQGGSSPSATTS